MTSQWEDELIEIRSLAFDRYFIETNLNRIEGLMPNEMDALVRFHWEELKKMQEKVNHVYGEYVDRRQRAKQDDS